jgi:mRNA interferase MazF
VSAAAAPARGQVWRADLGYGPKPWLIVSNNSRNRVLSDVLAIRITTTVRDLPTWVALSGDDPLVGHANADAFQTLDKDELTKHLGALCPATMRRVDQALRTALAL